MVGQPRAGQPFLQVSGPDTYQVSVWRSEGHEAAPGERLVRTPVVHTWLYNGDMDSYKTIEGMAQAEYEEKKSRFIGQVAHVETEEEAVAFLEGVRNANPMARHNVYAYVLRENNRVRYSDDGEPPRTSGLPTLSVIEHAELKDVICVTTRYFGGTLLGTGGLVRAYTKAAQDAFAAARTVTFASCCDIVMSIDYPLYDQLNHWLTGQGIQILETAFAADVTVEIRVLATDVDGICAAITELTHGSAVMLVGDAAFRPLATRGAIGESEL